MHEATAAQTTPGPQKQVSTVPVGQPVVLRTSGTENRVSKRSKKQPLHSLLSRRPWHHGFALQFAALARRAVLRAHQLALRGARRANEQQMLAANSCQQQQPNLRPPQ